MTGGCVKHAVIESATAPVIVFDEQGLVVNADGDSLQSGQGAQPDCRINGIVTPKNSELDTGSGLAKPLLLHADHLPSSKAFTIVARS